MNSLTATSNEALSDLHVCQWIQFNEGTKRTTHPQEERETRPRLDYQTWLLRNPHQGPTLASSDPTTNRVNERNSESKREPFDWCPR